MRDFLKSVRKLFEKDPAVASENFEEIRQCLIALQWQAAGDVAAAITGIARKDQRLIICFDPLILNIKEEETERLSLFISQALQGHWQKEGNMPLEVHIIFSSHQSPPPARPMPAPPSSISTNNIKMIVGIAAGKGGVGKSTVAFHLAYMLQKMGASVGLMDCDIYGPSAPTFLGTAPRLRFENHRLQPLMAHGIKYLSIGCFIDPQTAAIWRGPMMQKALHQMLQDAEWGPLDYLILDLPPGTGDIPLTLAQKFRLDGIVLVTTPHPLALADVRRSVDLFNKLSIPLWGLIYNMSTFQCLHCQHTHSLFGEEPILDEHFPPVWAHLPFDPHCNDPFPSSSLLNEESSYYQLLKKIALNLKDQNL